MFIRSLINISLLLALAYGSWQVIEGNIYQFSGWRYYFYLLSPWALLFASIKSWHRCFTWRRMIAAKNTSPILSRGNHKPLKRKPRIGILEWLCFFLILISIDAILQQLGIENAAMFIALGIGAYVALMVSLWVMR